MKIDVQLSKKGIKKAIKELEKYRDSLYLKQKLLVKRLGERGYRVMEEEIRSFPMPYSTGKITRHIIVRVGDTYCTISNDSDHALYIEFGTGIVGAWSPYENNTIGYEYDVNGHGYEGWYYYDKDEKRVRWTRGMPSRPFVHNTFIKLSSEVISIAKEVFGSDR